jgi:hypothetical protein
MLPQKLEDSNKQRLTEQLAIYRKEEHFDLMPVEKICENFKELPQLSWYKKHDSNRVNALVKLMLLNLIKVVQVDRTYEVKDVPLIASGIIADFWWFRVEDLQNAFARIYKGQFKVYARLDMPTLYEALHEYDMIRGEAWARFRESQDGQNKYSDYRDKKGEVKQIGVTISDLRIISENKK